MVLQDTIRTAHRRLYKRRRRDDSGLTTLEWLLIVAAVAGLAALAVVLVTNVVRDTSDDISGQNARLTAARIAADEVTTKAKAETVDSDDKAKTFNAKYKGDCNEIEVLYGDIEDLDAIWSLDISGAEADPNTVKPVAGNAVTMTAWTGATDIGCWVTTVP